LSTISPRHAQARALALAGKKVFPVEVGGKRPLPESNGFKDATCDLAQIDAWWNEADYNLAASPEDWGFGVVDFDNWSEVPFDYPATRTNKTPRGFHLWYKGSFPPSASKLGPGIDTRGVGSYVLLPPSIVNGAEYATIDEREPVGAPAFIADRLTRRRVESNPGDGRRVDLDTAVDRGRLILRDLVSRGDVAISGRGGNDRTYQLAARLREIGLSVRTAAQLISEIWNPHCVPPWDDWELEGIVAHAFDYGQNEAGVWSVEPTNQVFAGVAPPPRAPRRFAFETVAEQRAHPAPTWLLDDLIPDRAVTLAYGPKGSLKSFVALDLALGVATGHKTFGIQPARVGPVIYVSYLGEGIDDIRHRRVPAWQIQHQASDADLANFFLAEGPRLADPSSCVAFIDELRDHLTGKPAALIVLDTVFQLANGIKLVESAAPFRDFTDALVMQFACSVMALHHPPKADPGTAYGSQDLTANTPTILRIEREKRAVSVYVERQKGAQEPELPFTFKAHTVGPSLALTPTTPREHIHLTKQKDLVDRLAIHAVLNALRIVAPAFLSTDTLADHLVPLAIKDRQEEIEKTARSLRRLSKGDLRGFVDGQGEALRWSLPASE